MITAPQAQSKIKILEKLPDLEPPEAEESESFKCVSFPSLPVPLLRGSFSDLSRVRLVPSRFPDAEKISPPLLQLDNVTFGYTPEKIILKSVNIDVGLDSRIAVIGPNGAGESLLNPLPPRSDLRLELIRLLLVERDQVNRHCECSPSSLPLLFVRARTCL